MAGDAILIAAQSGRALAQAARRAGLRPFVADLFGDADILELAEAHRPLTGRFGTGRPIGSGVLACLEELAALAGGRRVGVVLGSGFEGAPDLIRDIAARHRLLGAAPDCVAALKDPFRFTSLCAEFAIPHPSVTREPLDDPKCWLLKRAGGSGGGHIRAATRGPPAAGAYFQARVPGRAFALNVLADGRTIRVLAVTEQWCTPAPGRPFRYAGALARAGHEPPPIPPGIIAAVTAAVDALVRRTGLRGLASADFLFDDGTWWLTEINPRPGATLDILDRRARPLLDAHVAACLGDLSGHDAAPRDAAASEICYAARDHRPVPAIDWPDHVRDRPRAGTTVVRGAPLCTVVATGQDAGIAERELRTRVAHLRDGLFGEEAHEYRTTERQRQAAEHQRPVSAPGGAADR